MGRTLERIACGAAALLLASIGAGAARAELLSSASHQLRGGLRSSSADSLSAAASPAIGRVAAISGQGWAAGRLSGPQGEVLRSGLWPLYRSVLDPCGDGVIDVGEQCDDGGLGAGDGCSARCQLERSLSFAGSAAGGQSVDLILEGRLVSVSTVAGDLGADVAAAFVGQIRAHPLLAHVIVFASGSVLVVTGSVTGAQSNDPGIQVSPLLPFGAVPSASPLALGLFATVLVSLGAFALRSSRTNVHCARQPSRRRP